MDTQNFQRVTWCMQSEKKYCIKLRFIESHGLGIARVYTLAHERVPSARSTKASVSQVHSTITRRHTPLIFIAVFPSSQRLPLNDTEKPSYIFTFSLCIVEIGPIRPGFQERTTIIFGRFDRLAMRFRDDSRRCHG